MTTKGGDDETEQLKQSAKRAIIGNCSAKRDAPQLKEEPWFLQKVNVADNVKSLLTQLVYDSRRNAERFAELTADCLIDAINKRQRATEVHACFLLEDIEIREFIERYKHTTEEETKAEIQILSLSGGDELSVKFFLDRDVYSLRAGEGLELDNVKLNNEVSFEIVSGSTALGKKNYFLAPKDIPSPQLMKNSVITVKAPLELKGVTMMLQTVFKLSIQDRVELLRDNLQDLEDKLRQKDEHELKLGYLMEALDIALDEDQVFRSTLKKPPVAKDRDCECSLL
mmetsp:Transcript_5783/g.10317  ORF Transcript_5783/g.10317 Transcript_5783/m.10317 type:complete len:283 (+) Transcript_5783:30-878(+)